MSGRDAVKEAEAGNGLSSMDSNGPNGIDHAEQMRNVLTNTMSISPELFERVYLGPQNRVKGDLRRILANPTPLGVMGFAVGLFPLSIEFMGWRGSGGFAVATTTCSIWYGGVLLFFAGIFEFILGNTFPFVVFMGYGAHFLTFATTFMPFFNTLNFYSGDSVTSAKSLTPMWAAGFGFYPLTLAMLSFVFLFLSMRTNLVFVLIFICATIGFSMAAAATWYVAEANMGAATTMTIGTGACFFVADLLGWYLFASIMITELEWPCPDLPVYDLSTVIKGKSRRKED